jgi:hypothetical protein
MKGKTIILKSQEPRITANILKSRFKIMYDFNATKSPSDYPFIENKKGRQDPVPSHALLYNFVSKQRN